MKILFLNKNFYEYDSKIKEELEKQGHNVRSFCITPRLSFTDKIKKECKLISDLEKKVLDYQMNILEEIKEESFDFIFVIAGQGLRRETLYKLKEMYPEAVLIWYMWDNICNLKNFSQIHDCFDLVISFDKIEAERINVEYLPLFYLNENVNNTKIYDISMIGQDRQYRRDTICDVRKNSSYKKCFFYLKTGKKEILKCIVNRKFSELALLHTKNIPYKEIEKVMQQSKVVLDIPAPNQTGLTMRTIETLGSHTKIITTNKYVKNYDFYNENNVLVIDPENIIIPENFIDNEYMEVDKDILYSYSIKAWCEKLLCFVEEIRRQH